MNPLVSRSKAEFFFFTILCVGLAILFFTGSWWPEIFLPIGFALSVKQYLRGRYYDIALSIILFTGTYVSFAFRITWEAFMPVLFTLGALYLLSREYFTLKKRACDTEEEELNKELEEEQQP